MNKGEFVEAVAKKTGLPKSQVRSTVDACLETIKGSLKAGNPVAFAGFGTFVVAKRKERMGRNPRTGATLKIPAAKVPRFRAGKGLKDAVK